MRQRNTRIGGGVKEVSARSLAATAVCMVLLGTGVAPAATMGVYPFSSPPASPGIGLLLSETVMLAISEHPDLSMVERVRLEDVSRELELQQSDLFGMVRQARAHFSGADRIVAGVVVEQQGFWIVRGRVVSVGTGDVLDTLGGTPTENLREMHNAFVRDVKRVFGESTGISPVADEQVIVLTAEGLLELERQRYDRAAEQLERAVRADTTYTLAARLLDKCRAELVKTCRRQQWINEMLRDVPGLGKIVPPVDADFGKALFDPSTISLYMALLCSGVGVGLLTPLDDWSEGRGLAKGFGIGFGVLGLASATLSVQSKIIERKIYRIQVRRGVWNDYIKFAVGWTGGFRSTPKGVGDVLRGFMPDTGLGRTQSEEDIPLCLALVLLTDANEIRIYGATYSTDVTYSGIHNPGDTAEAVIRSGALEIGEGALQYRRYLTGKIRPDRIHPVLGADVSMYFVTTSYAGADSAWAEAQTSYDDEFALGLTPIGGVAFLAGDDLSLWVEGGYAIGPFWGIDGVCGAFGFSGWIVRAGLSVFFAK